VRAVAGNSNETIQMNNGAFPMSFDRKSAKVFPDFIFPPLFSLTQKNSFKANCTCLDDPDSPVGNRVFVIRPNVGVPMMLPGCPKFA
jgi:hypothetical protein